MKTSVVTLNKEAFAAHCSKLEKLVAASFRPDLIVGIREGGTHVSELMFHDVAHVAVSMHRPSTRHKRNLSRRLMRSFPYAVLNRMRLLEARWLHRHAPRPYPEETLPAEVPLLPTSAQERILIVDDAVDSGRTLEVVHRWLRSKRPSADIRAAVIAVTTERPLMMPQYYLYYPNTLIRFPWSIDFKTQA